MSVCKSILVAIVIPGLFVSCFDFSMAIPALYSPRSVSLGTCRVNSTIFSSPAFRVISGWLKVIQPPSALALLWRVL